MIILNPQQNNSRGQATLVGFILLVAIAIVFSSLMIDGFVTNSNESREINNSEQVKNQFDNLPSKINLSLATDTIQTISINGNVNYMLPSIINPVEPIIDISTPRQQTVEVSGSSTESVTSDVIQLHPKYHFYVVDSLNEYSQNVVYYKGRSDSERIFNPTSQKMINGTDITVYNVDGVNSSGESANISIYPEQTKTIDTINTNSNEVTITIETKLSANQWEKLLEKELVANGGHVEDINQVDSNTVEIRLENGYKYSYTEYTVDIRTSN